MEFRHSILKEALDFYSDKGPRNFMLSSTMRSFVPGDAQCLTAVNQLLAEGLLVATETPTGEIAVALNPAKLAEAREEVSPRSKPNNPWITGSFYLAALLLIVVVVRVAFGPLNALWIPTVVVGGILAVSVIGAFQLRNDDRLAESSFLSLMFKTFEYLPFVRLLTRRSPEPEGGSKPTGPA